jgi:TRAP-type C4-dicarboxylate transport system substrate-binding protein
MTTDKKAKVFSRRDFLKTAVVGTVALTGLTACAPAASSSGQPAKWDVETDVLVCGSGAGGLPAAIEAADAGSNVLVIEKLDYIGGSMRRCGGGIFAGPTKISKALGVKDSVDSVYSYIIRCGEGTLDPDLIRTIAENIGPSFDWFVENLGAPIPSRFAPDFAGGLIPAGVVHNSYGAVGFEEVPRMYILSGLQNYKPFKDGQVGGAAIFDVYQKALKARKNIQIKMETALAELVVTENKEVLGVKAVNAGKTLYIKANKAVVLATGGWINNEKMLKTFDPRSRWYRIDAVEKTKSSDESIIGWPLYLALPELSHGEGTEAAMAIGADLTNMSVIAENIDTNGGLRINSKTEVLDVFGNPIPRLFAAGYTAGGWMGYLDPSGGSRTGTSFTLGRIAGINAAALKPQGSITFPTPAPVIPVLTLQPTKERVFQYSVAIPAAETASYVVNGYTPWAKSVSDATKGKLELKFSYAESLAPAAQTVEAVKDDDADLGHLLTDLYPDTFLVEGMVGLPGLGITNSTQATKILAALRVKFVDQFSKEYGIVKLLNLYAGAPSVLATKQPVTALADINGLKIAVETATLADAVTALGATGSVLDAKAIAAALKSGDVNGAILDWQEIADNSLSDQVDNFTEIGLSVKPYATIINNPRWIALPLTAQDSLSALVGDQGSLFFAENGIDKPTAVIRTQIQGMSGKTVSQLSSDDIGNMNKATEAVRTKYIAAVTSKGFPAQDIYNEIVKQIPLTK